MQRQALPKLSVKALAARRGQRLLWQGLTAQWSAGQAVWVRGANGVGKTTLLEVLAGLRQPLAGSMGWGMDDSRVNPDGNIPVGDGAAFDTPVTQSPLPSFLLGHRHPLHPHLTVVENLRYWQRLWWSVSQTSQPSQPPPPKLDPLLADWQLQAVASQLVGNLSAGQRQRVGLCLLTLLPWRPLWLLDEPATALDYQGVGQLAHCMQNHLAAGGLCLFTSHQALPINAACWDL